MQSRKLIVLLATVALAMLVMAPASAKPTAEQKGDAGWTCFPAGPVANIHCLSPSQGGGAAASAQVFSPDGDTYLGTESLRFTDRDLSEIPCPKDGGHWHEIDEDTWACHHWKGAPS